MIVALTQADLLALADRVAEGYVTGLKAGDGYEVVQAAAAVLARASTAAQRTDEGLHIKTAPAGDRASVTLRIARPVDVTGAVTVKAGSIARADQERDFRLLEDVPFGGGDLGPHDAPAEALFEGYGYNVPEGSITAWATLSTVPPNQDRSFTVTNPAAAVDGAPAMLDAHARDRGLLIAGASQEGAQARRKRLLAPLDTVAPGAIDRAVAGVLAPLGATWQLIEAHEPTLCGGWDTARTDPAALQLAWVWDYAPAGYTNRWLSLATSRAAGVVVVPNLPAIRDQGMAWDDLGPDATRYGRRAAPAWDVTFGASAGMLALHGAWDGTDQRKAQAYLQVVDALDNTKAAGVIAMVELAGE